MTAPSPAPAQPPTPALSAAEALAEAPFFRKLSPVDLARLVPELEEHHFRPGQAVFCRGEPGDGLYLVRSGRARLRVPTDDGGSSVDVIEAPETFGEVALLADRPREADVLAETPLAVWKLPRERFAALVSEQAHLALEIAAALAERLAEANGKLSATKQQVAVAARAAYGTLDPVAQALLRRGAVLGEFDRELLRALLREGWSDEAFERALREAVFLREVDRAGWLTFSQEAVRGFLLQQLRAELGDRGLAAWRRRAAEALLARGEGGSEHTLAVLAEAGDWPRLCRLMEEQADQLAKRRPERVEGFLRAAPAELLWCCPRLVWLLAECCAAQGKLEQAIEVYREAERHDPVAREGALALRYQELLVDLHERVGREEDALACRRRISELRERLDGQTDLDDGAAHLQADIPPIAEQEGRPGGPPHRRPLSGAAEASALPLLGLPAARPSPRWVAAAGIFILAGSTWAVPPPWGLSPEAFRVLGTLAALVALSFLDVLPDYLLGLLMLGAWVASGTLPAEVAASGFAGSTFFLLLGAMGVGAAVERSGLLYRGALELVRRLPPSHSLRCLILGGLGALFTMAMPSGPARVLLAAPLALDISDSLRYPHRSGGSAGLALATFVGFGLMGNLFLTGNPMALLLYGLLPAESQARMHWGGWLLAALPTHLVLFALSMGFVLWQYRPESDGGVRPETVALQRRVLGPFSHGEKLALATVGLLVAGFATQALHRIDPAWIAIAALGLLFAGGALDDDGLRQGANLSFLLYVGVVLGFGQVFAHVGLDQWLGQRLTGLTDLTGGSQLAFVLAVAAASTLCGLLFRPGPVGLLIYLGLAPTAAGLGIDPWVVAMATLLPMMFWLYPQQNMLYLTAYHGTAEQGFSHAQARPLAFVYAAAAFAALAISVPIWRWMGLIS